MADTTYVPVTVGRDLVQAAALRGAEVIAVVRHSGATDRLLELGASHVIVAEAADAVEATAGVDVFVDTTGELMGRTHERSEQVLSARRSECAVVRGRVGESPCPSWAA